MKRITTQEKRTTGRFLLLTLLLAVTSLHGLAQAECFEYEDEGETIISSLTEAGRAATSLTIPASVTTVRSGAFYYALQGNTPLSSLIIEDGGNPLFESNLFERAHTLSSIDTGNGMSEARIYALLASLGSAEALDKVYIKAYTENEGVNWLTDEIKAVLTSDVSVTLPAALVSDQVFGDAVVCGRFTIERELITFCGIVTFEDTDDGSNMLFYVADSFDKEKGSIHIQRVRYVKEGEGILIHNIKNTSTYADLPRYTGSIIGTVETLYGKNMLKGVVEPTTIGATEEDGVYTNMVLYNGSFIRTSGGTLGANRAYLHMPTENLAGVAADAKFSLSYDDDEATDIDNIGQLDNLPFDKMSDVWYDLGGRKIVNPSNGQMPKGIYIQNGKKYVVR